MQLSPYHTLFLGDKSGWGRVCMLGTEPGQGMRNSLEKGGAKCLAGCGQLAKQPPSESAVRVQAAAAQATKPLLCRILAQEPMQIPNYCRCSAVTRQGLPILGHPDSADVPRAIWEHLLITCEPSASCSPVWQVLLLFQSQKASE